MFNCITPTFRRLSGTLTCAPSITSMLGPGKASFTTMRSRLNPSTVVTSLALTNVPIKLSALALWKELSMIWIMTAIACNVIINTYYTVLQKFPTSGRDNLVFRVYQISGYTTLSHKYPWYLVLPVNILMVSFELSKLRSNTGSCHSNV